MSQNDKRLMEEYEVQVRELREKLDDMEDQLKKKDDDDGMRESNQRPLTPDHRETEGGHSGGGEIRGRRTPGLWT